MIIATGEMKKELNSKLKKLKLAVREKNAIAKANWNRKQSDIIHQMRKFLSQAWEAYFRLAKGDYSHHWKHVTMKIRMKN